MLSSNTGEAEKGIRRWLLVHFLRTMTELMLASEGRVWPPQLYVCVGAGTCVFVCDVICTLCVWYMWGVSVHGASAGESVPSISDMYGVCLWVVYTWEVWACMCCMVCCIYIKSLYCACSLSCVAYIDDNMCCVY